LHIFSLTGYLKSWQKINSLRIGSSGRVPQGSIFTPILYSLHINDAPVRNWTPHPPFADDTSIIYNREAWMSSSMQIATRPQCSEVVVWALGHTINQWENQAIYLSRSHTVPGDVLSPRPRNIPFVNNVKSLGVIFDRTMTWGLHDKRTVLRPWEHSKDLYRIKMIV
jgi:hypothetical protein